MVAPGNHEHWFNFSGYRHRFDMPLPAGKAVGEDRRNLWSSYDFGTFPLTPRQAFLLVMAKGFEAKSK